MNSVKVLLCLFLLTTVASAQSRCFICSSQQGLRTIRVGNESLKICQECREQDDLCSLCRRGTNTEFMRDGRRICSTCKSTRILTQPQLESLYDGVQAFLKADPTGVMVNYHLPVQIADKDEIQTKMIEGGRAVSVEGFYSPYNPEKIYILSGQTKDSAGSTLVHEYTHAWQSRNCPSQDRALKEGFASYIAYRYLMHVGQPGMARQLTRHSDPDYGASLVKLLEMEKQKGVKGVMEFVKTARQLP